MDAAEQVLPHFLVIVALQLAARACPPVGCDGQHAQVSSPSAVMAEGSVREEVDAGAVPGACGSLAVAMGC